MSAIPLHTQHERLFQDNRFVYPVVSRRAGGISVGVNLNPDKVCNFHCIYCQVDRASPAHVRFVECDRLVEELDQMLQQIVSGSLFASARFRHVPEKLRRLNDIAFSGDGEPTTYRNFDQIVAACAEVRRRRALGDVKMVLITNASMLDRPHVQRALQILDANHGEIWAKLDAGTEPYFRRVNRAAFPLARILENITAAAKLRPLVIQSLFMRIDGEGPPDAEIDAYSQRLNEVLAAGGSLRLVQIYTIARVPREPFVTPLPSEELHAIAERVRRSTGLAVAVY